MAFRWDLEETSQSRLSIGIEDFNRSRDIRGFASDAGFGADKLKSTLDSAISEAGQYSPNFQTGDVPLSDVGGYRFGRNIIGSAVYQRGRNSVPRHPTFDFVRESVLDSFYESVYTFPGQEYYHSSYPDLTLYTSYHQRFIKTVTLGLGAHTRLSFHPRPQLVTNMGGTLLFADMKMVINSVDFVINGVTRAPGTLRFHDINIDPIDTNAGIEYMVSYVLEEKARGWTGSVIFSHLFRCGDITPSPVTLGDCGTDDSYIWFYSLQQIPIDGSELVVGPLTFESAYTAVDFNNLFPTHDNPSGDPGGTPGGPIPL